MSLRTPYIALIILTFSLLTSMFVNLAWPALPNVSEQAVSTLDQNALSQMTQLPNVTSSDNTGDVGYYSMIINGTLTAIKIVIGVLCVAVPLANMGVPVWICIVIQPILYAVILFEQLGYLRGLSL